MNISEAYPGRERRIKTFLKCLIVAYVVAIIGGPSLSCIPEPWHTVMVVYVAAYLPVVPFVVMLITGFKGSRQTCGRILLAINLIMLCVSICVNAAVFNCAALTAITIVAILMDNYDRKCILKYQDKLKN